VIRPEFADENLSSQLLALNFILIFVLNRKLNGKLFRNLELTLSPKLRIFFWNLKRPVVSVRVYNLSDDVVSFKSGIGLYQDYFEHIIIIAHYHYLVVILDLDSPSSE
jgi:hypothetical protein